MPESAPAVAPGFEWRVTAAGRALVCVALDAIAPHLFTARPASPLHGLDPDYRAVGAHFQLPPDQVVRVRQVHGRDVLVVRGTGPEAASDGDAIVSRDPARAVSVRIADCVPILLADRGRRVVAAIHAGWRGTAAGVTPATVDAITELGVAPADLVAAIGPSIGPCCYQVDGIVREQFESSHPAAREWFSPDEGDRWRLDLWRANRAQLEAAGVPSSSISSAQACTAHDRANWYSFRRDGAAAGRMVAAIRLVRTASE